MAAFDAACGLPALLARLGDTLNATAITVTGHPLQVATPAGGNDSVIRPRERPLLSAGTLAILRGNLAPRGAILRTTTASPQLFYHRGPALVFDSYAEMLERIDAPDLPVTPATVLILRNAGAVGVPGMPEWGAIPVPKKLLAEGVRDMVRLSDARMSGTSVGTIVLHVAPEAAIGGPLALVHDGDLIELDVERRQINLLVSPEIVKHRQALWRPKPVQHTRGYPQLYAAHVLQPDEGCDFDFLRPQSDADLVFVPPVVGRS
jgi:dihydroxy-acid dehydratase